ncbi:MAG: hypothetical protein JNM56_17250 [Planctomycetia bacterium]|nr:hypothetical protein [Planctomycetia bacterium]
MNPAQELQLQRLRLGSFNNLDGNRVADDLRDHKGLWLSFVFGGFEYQPLIELRDLPQGRLRGDTLYLLTHRDKLDGLLDLVKRWKADEVGWLAEDRQEGVFVNKSAFDLIGAFLGPSDVLVRVWWD